VLENGEAAEIAPAAISRQEEGALGMFVKGVPLRVEGNPDVLSERRHPPLVAAIKPIGKLDETVNVPARPRIDNVNDHG
jgi:hypothetical protein